MMFTLRSSVALLVGATLSFGAGCERDDGLQSRFGNRVGVTAGDFDEVSAPLKRMDAAHTVFEGLISSATWDPSFDPANADLKVEDLFIGSNGSGQLDTTVATFVGSGTRGFGDRQYNGLDQDDQLVQDGRTQDNTRRFVNRGSALLVTDWAYELPETIWPDAIDFLDSDPSQAGGQWINLDLAQKGRIAQITARITDPDLAEALGSDTMAVDFPFSNWAVIEDVGDDVTVHVRGDVSYLPDLTAEPVSLTDVPLLVSFYPEGESGGQVIYSAFHVDAQNSALMDEMLVFFFGTFEPEDSNAVIE